MLGLNTEADKNVRAPKDHGKPSTINLLTINRFKEEGGA
jgi:hypothetical protein